MLYRWHTGSVAWLIHRVTGILLTLYIFLHLYVLSHLKDPVSYRKMMLLMNNPVIKLSEVGLLGLVLAHALNGVRITLLELGVSTKLQKRLFWSALLIGTVLFVLGGWPIIGGGL
ncbi:MAG TPA: succinate dehydrogenase, cytochrome b556 subunit [Nitrospirae bacterium]|nr:succinate dehydrogenase, cytochrome b556 subunit [Nitrospirota bacterium]